MRPDNLLAAAAVIALIAGSALAQDTSTPKITPKSMPKADTLPAAASAEVERADGDIIQAAQATGHLTTFLKAVEATNLTDILKADGALTVFAPTDAAFAALPAGELDKLMLPENKAELQNLLAGHVIDAQVTSADFKGANRRAPTLAGTTVELNGRDKPMVNDAVIVQADVRASNGVIQVIDKVLLPGVSAIGPAAAGTASDSIPDPAATPR